MHVQVHVRVRVHVHVHVHVRVRVHVHVQWGWSCRQQTSTPSLERRPTSATGGSHVLGAWWVGAGSVWG